jgi:hypothetical protein
MGPLTLLKLKLYPQFGVLLSLWIIKTNLVNFEMCKCVIDLF